mmetsp:Transcript_21584/g.35603  ORF Transcript_21584/g.35603 Transcript_21584/m.35603 type:complete len:165 (+) Transcript_21584:71-565(+)
MKVVFASVSAVLLGSIPTALSAESNLRGGAALVTDFEDQAADLIGLDGDTDKDDKDNEKAAKKLEKKLKSYEKDLKTYDKLRKAFKNAEKECKDLTESDCDVATTCGWNAKKEKCVTSLSAPKEPKKPKFAEDEEDFYFDSSEDLFDTEDYDWDEDAEDYVWRM